MNTKFEFHDPIGRSVWGDRSRNAKGPSPSPMMYAGEPLQRMSQGGQMAGSASSGKGERPANPKLCEDGQEFRKHDGAGSVAIASPFPRATAKLLAQWRGRTAFRSRKDDDDEPPPCPVTAYPPPLRSVPAAGALVPAFA